MRLCGPVGGDEVEGGAVAVRLVAALAGGGDAQVVGVLIGSLLTAPLEGSLLVVFVFLLDAFAAPAERPHQCPACRATLRVRRI